VITLAAKLCGAALKVRALSLSLSLADQFITAFPLCMYTAGLLTMTSKYHG